MSTDQLIERIVSATKIDVTHFSNAQITSFTDQIRDFVVKIKGVFPLLEQFKSQIHMMEHSRAQTVTYYKKFAEFIGKYEGKMLETYITDDRTSRVSMFSDDTSGDRERLSLKNELNKMS